MAISSTPAAGGLVLSSREHARRIGELGELRAALEQARDDDPAGVDVLDARIQSLEQLLETCTVSDERHSRLGATLEVEDLDRGSRLRYRLVAPFDRGGPSAVSLASPVGAALAGLAVGEEAEVRLEGGRSRRLRLLGVQAGAEEHNDR